MSSLGNSVARTAEYDQLLEVLQARRSIRRFTEQPVAREELWRVLEAARWAPSNHNRQPWKFLVLQEKPRIQALADAVREKLAEKLKNLPSVASGYATELLHYATFFEHAPVLLVVLHKQPISASAALLEGVTNPSLVSGEPISVAMAVQNVLLAAATLGLGSCVLTGPLLVEETVATFLKIPPGLDLNCFVALGYPGESPEPPRRKPLEQIVEFPNGTG